MAEQAAEELQGVLKRPCLLKRMTKSQISGGFWLGGFGQFREFMPNKIADLALEHRDQHWPVRWLSDNPGLSGGWKRFAKDHQLEENDIVVFEKKDDTVLKAFIFKLADYTSGPPQQEPYFKDASAIDFQGRQLQGEIKQKEAKPALKQEASKEVSKPKKKKPSPVTDAAEAVDADVAQLDDPRGSPQASGNDEAGPSTRKVPGQNSKTPTLDPKKASEKPAKEAAVAAAVAGSIEQKDAEQRRAPCRHAKDAAAAAITAGFKTDWQAKQQQDVAGPSKAAGPSKEVSGGKRKASEPADKAGQKAAKKSKTEGDAKAAGKKAGGKAEKPPKAPKVRAPPKNKKVAIWEYEYTGKAAEYAKALKAKYAEIMKDAITVDKKTGAVLSGPQPDLMIRGYKNISWLYNNGRYEPIHVIMK